MNEIIFHREMGIIETPFTAGQFRLKKGVPQAVRRLNRLGLKTVVVSNQPGVAMHHFSQSTLKAITRKMITELGRENAFLDGIYYCIHHPTKGVGKLRRTCSCRKPRAGLFTQAARAHGIDLKKSYMIGDSIFDVQAGRKAGCKTFLLAHLKCDLCYVMEKRGIRPHYLVKNLSEAVMKIARLERN